MRHRNLFFLTTMFGLMATYSCHAMENNSKTLEPIKLDNGLLTLVPEILVELRSEGFFSPKHFIGKIEKSENCKRSLVDLMSNIYVVTKQDGKYVTTSIFSPTIVRIGKDNSLKDLGSFSGPRHEEAKEACRQKKALFYPYQQGLLLYSLDELVLSSFETKKFELEKMVMENKEKMLSILIPVYYSLQ